MQTCIQRSIFYCLDERKTKNSKVKERAGNRSPHRNVNIIAIRANIIQHDNHRVKGNQPSFTLEITMLVINLKRYLQLNTDEIFKTHRDRSCGPNNEGL